MSLVICFTLTPYSPMPSLRYYMSLHSMLRGLASKNSNSHSFSLSITYSYSKLCWIVKITFSSYLLSIQNDLFLETNKDRFTSIGS